MLLVLVLMGTPILILTVIGLSIISSVILHFLILKVVKCIL